MRAKKVKGVLLKRKQKIKKVLIVFGLIILICLIYWFIFLSSFFQIKKIEVLNYNFKQVKELEREIDSYFQKKNRKFVPQIIEKIYKGAKGNYRNMLLFSSLELSSFLKAHHKEFKEVKSVLLITSQTLKVNIFLREPKYLLCFKDQSCYFIDNEGIIYEKAGFIANNLYRKIIAENSFEFNLGDQIFNKEKLALIEKYYSIFDQKESPFKIDSLIFDFKNQLSFKLKTNQGFYLYLNFKEDPNHILKILNQLKEVHNLKNLEYIDCRFLPKIYLK